ncbi:hypothetical protein FRB99_000604 [Tulasnella sp. 403]|nr:hypothetical protein FRB99_000604 [Tulasnella sp. 403]
MGALFSHPKPEDPITTVKLQGSKNKLRMEGGGYPVDVSGSFCDVFKAYDEKTQQRFALKRYRAAAVSASGITEEQAKWFEQESRHWQSLNHRHVLHLHGIAKDTFGGMYLVSPWIEHGSLWKYIRVNPDCDRSKYLRQTAEALVYLHSKNLIHGDIKAQNVLISENDDALLSDFGLSKVVSTQTMAGLKGVAPLRFQAPELWKGASRNVKTDVYAFGMLIYQVLSGSFPFRDCQAHAAIYMKVVEGGERPPREPSESPTGKSYESLWDVAEKCWQEDPDDRPSMREVALALPSVISESLRRKTVGPSSQPSAREPRFRERFMSFNVSARDSRPATPDISYDFPSVDPPEDVN